MTTPENNDGIIKTSISFDHSKYEEQRQKQLAAMKPAALIEITIRLIVYPCCGESTGSSSEHLPIGSDWGPWYCDSCGQGIRGFNSPTGVLVDKAHDRIVKTLVLLKLRQQTKEPIHIVVEGIMFVKNDEKPEDLLEKKQSKDRYYYNVHTCPWNYLNAHIAENGDPDSHGVFEHVQTIIKPKADENEKIITSGGYDFPDDYYAWMDLFPILQ